MLIAGSGATDWCRAVLLPALAGDDYSVAVLSAAAAAEKICEAWCTR